MPEPASTRKPTPQACNSPTMATRCFRSPSQAIRLSDGEGIAGLQGLEAGIKAVGAIPATRCTVLTNARLVNAGTGQDVALQVEYLAAVRLGDTRVADQQAV